MDPNLIPDIVIDRWEDLTDDAEATADAYRSDGWETLVVTPGDVTPLDSDLLGLDLLLPGNEYEALARAVEEATVDTAHVYRATDGGVHFYVFAYEASDAGVAVVCPAYLPLADAVRLEPRAREEGAMYVHCRPLSGDDRLTFTHDDPELFF